MCFNPLYFFLAACDFAVTELWLSAFAKELVRNGLSGTSGVTSDSNNKDQLRFYGREGNMGVSGVISLASFLCDPHTAFSK